MHTSIEPLRDVRNHFSEVVARIHQHHERVTVTKNGRPVAVVVSPEDLPALEKTLAVLADATVSRDVRDGDAAYASDNVVRGSDAIRSLRA